MKAGCGMRRYVACVALIAVALATGTARGEFMLVENFEGLQLSAIDGQNGWYASSPTSVVVTLPGEGANQTLKAVATPAVLHKGATISQGATRTLFLRFRFEGQHAYSFGMSHQDSPTQIEDFGPELRRVSALDRFEIHNGQRYDLLTTLQPATWYNLWALIDNDSGNTQVWLHSRAGEGATPADQLDADGPTVFDFRTNLNTDLVNFYIKAAQGGNGNDPLWIDDIYLEDADGLNLANPVPEPNSLICLASAAAVLLASLRRRKRPA